ncbi:glycosyltransferase [Dokdonella soli]|uniref:Glycosyltransferase family 1 protein n=1 Tax=Dokdonella soli TaxID=529810 RepID=A0ABN1IN66_9GAMM
MHIVDVTLFFAPHSGGVKRYLLAKQRHFATRTDVRHTLLVPGPHTGAPAPGLIELASPRIPFGGGYRLPLHVREWAATLQGLKPDLIEVADPYHLAWIALGVAERLGVPAVAFAHSDLARLFGDRFAPSIGRAAGIYLRNLYRRFDCVFAPSRLIAERLTDLGVANIAVQPLGVDGEAFHPRRTDPGLRRELGLADDTRLLVFAGRMAREKEIPLLLKTFERLGAPYHLLLVGGERHEPLTANATMLPYQQDSIGLARLLASCDALIHAGRHETFGMIVIEAMACARPVVAVRAGAITELVGADVGEVAEPDDAASLADAVRRLYGRDRVTMGACARERVQGSYLWERTLSCQLQRYTDLVHAHAPSAAIDAPSREVVEAS